MEKQFSIHLDLLYQEKLIDEEIGQPLVSERGISVAQAARDLDIHENVLRRWVRFIKYLSVMVTCRVSVAATS